MLAVSHSALPAVPRLVAKLAFVAAVATGIVAAAAAVLVDDGNVVLPATVEEVDIHPLLAVEVVVVVVAATAVVEIAVVVLEAAKLRLLVENVPESSAKSLLSSV